MDSNSHIYEMAMNELTIIGLNELLGTMLKNERFTRAGYELAHEYVNTGILDTVGGDTACNPTVAIGSATIKVMAAMEEYGLEHRRTCRLVAELTELIVSEIVEASRPYADYEDMLDRTAIHWQEILGQAERRQGGLMLAAVNERLGQTAAN